MEIALLLLLCVCGMIAWKLAANERVVLDWQNAIYFFAALLPFVGIPVGIILAVKFLGPSTPEENCGLMTLPAMVEGTIGGFLGGVIFGILLLLAYSLVRAAHRMLTGRAREIGNDLNPPAF